MKKIVTAAFVLMPFLNLSAADLWQDVTEAETNFQFEKSLLDRPAPISVITAEDIIAFGIESIVDAIALFPGMSLARNEYFDISMGYHELSPVSPRRMQVLIDDTTVLQSGLQSVTWWNLPISIDDVERIELTRAPSVINHGSGSFNGTIHIKTKRKTERRVVSAKYSADGLSNRLTARYQDRFNNSLVAVTASKMTSSGFSNLNDDSDNNTISLSYDYEHKDLQLGATFKQSQGYKQGRTGEYSDIAQKVEQNIRLFGFSADYNLNDQSSLHVSFSNSQWYQFESLNVAFPFIVASDLLRELYNLDSETATAIVYGGDRPDSDYRYYDLYKKIAEKYQEDPTIYNIKAPLEVDENRKAIHTSYSFQNEAWDFSLGYSFLEDTIFSPVYLLDFREHRQLTRQLYTNVSYTQGDTTISSSLMHETTSQGNAHDQGRVSGLYRLTDSSSVRASVSKSFRTPSLWEEQGGFRYFMEFEDNPHGITSGIWFQEQIAAGGLQPEENTYFELGYHYANLMVRTEFDLSVYYSRYEGLILDLATIESFDLGNNHDIDLYGVEAELTTAVAGHNFKVFGSIASSRINKGQPIIDDERGYSLDNAGFTPQFKLNVLHSYQVNDLLNLISELGMVNGSSKLDSHYIKFGFAKAFKVLYNSQIKATGFIRYTDSPLIASSFIRQRLVSSHELNIGGSVKISF